MTSSQNLVNAQVNALAPLQAGDYVLVAASPTGNNDIYLDKGLTLLAKPITVQPSQLQLVLVGSIFSTKTTPRIGTTIPTAANTDFGRLIDRKQEDLILGQGAPPEPIASLSSSQKPQGMPEAAPAPEPEYPVFPPPSPVLNRPSLPISSLPRSSPPPPDPEDLDPGAEVSDPESDDDNDNMSKVFKAFDKVSTLKSDGSNWDTWKNRVELATQSIGFSDHLTSNPKDDTEAWEAKKDDNGNLLNAIVGRLSDQIYRRYKNYENRTYNNSFIPSMRCHEPSKVNEHLDKLLEIRDSLEARKITIPKEMFNNMIIASIPNIFKPMINALVVVAARMSVPLTTRELVSTIHAEASGHTRGQSGKKESANYAGGNFNCGRGGFN
ncbi:hypothetical protein F5877DRAFT_80491 [Lentinula edodes]|nr:hypothetical protein F5877DRAFT_80491 [Lentinula edodes]